MRILARQAMVRFGISKVTWMETRKELGVPNSDQKQMARCCHTQIQRIRRFPPHKATIAERSAMYEKHLASRVISQTMDHSRTLGSRKIYQSDSPQRLHRLQMTGL